MDKKAAIFVAGHATLLGSALLRELQRQGYSNVIGAAAEPDLTDPHDTDAFFRAEKPEYVFLTAGKSGGIQANQRYPADLIFNIRYFSMRRSTARLGIWSMIGVPH